MKVNLHISINLRSQAEIATLSSASGVSSGLVVLTGYIAMINWGEYTVIVGGWSVGFCIS
jgi:hypothetical protein